MGIKSSYEVLFMSKLYNVVSSTNIFLIIGIGKTYVHLLGDKDTYHI